MKAIETEAYGLRFRSRAEARWSVVFHELKLTFLYEDEGFDLDGTRYLPDFYLPDLGLFFEVKGAADWRDDAPTVTKCKALARIAERRVVVVAGEIPNPHPWFAGEHLQNGVMLFPNSDEDFPYWLCECDRCHAIGIEYAGRADLLSCGCMARLGIKPAYAPHSQRLIDAYTVARQARFEHGEAPL